LLAQPLDQSGDGVTFTGHTDQHPLGIIPHIARKSQVAGEPSHRWTEAYPLYPAAYPDFRVFHPGHPDDGMVNEE
jgi:hypothetical protein